MVNVLNGRPSSFASPQHAIDWAMRSHMSRNKEAAAISMPSQLRQADSGQWLWHTPLFDSRQHWQGWYAGLSEAFLALPCPKVLALAGTDRCGAAAVAVIGACALLPCTGTAAWVTARGWDQSC